VRVRTSSNKLLVAVDMELQIEMKLEPNNHSVGLALAGFRTLVAMGYKLVDVLNAKNPSTTPHDHVLEQMLAVSCKEDTLVRGARLA
jgi:hypothetical protein